MLRKSTRNRLPMASALAAALVLAAGLAGCRVQVDKGANGQDKKVQVDTPFGGIHVNTDQTTATDLGLPVYPGAVIERDKDNNKSADVHMGFGEWELRVRAVSYASSDSQEKVADFYKKALGRYGNVITCQNNAAIGTPTVTTEGLGCDDGKHTKVQIDSNDFSKGSYELKAGSPRHQHIVGFKSPKDGRTRFALVALDLPADVAGKSD